MDRGGLRIMTDAATRRPAPTNDRMKCHQLQLNCRVTATDVDEAQAVKRVQPEFGSCSTTVPVNRAMVHRANITQSPTTTTIRNG